mmetsp:Transcript_2773/g.4025  ORF Transcript_2773/g.4025 Transcript_2773/m.4025 type:complete len:105 (-) Transcript_2773:16-330(-)
MIQKAIQGSRHSFIHSFIHSLTHSPAPVTTTFLDAVVVLKPDTTTRVVVTATMREEHFVIFSSLGSSFLCVQCNAMQYNTVRYKQASKIENEEQFVVLFFFFCC